MPYNPTIFQVNWQRFARMLTPVELRKSKLMALLYAALSPLADVHGRFLAFRANVQYRLGINYQVCRLEKLLNDTYDTADRRIYINNEPPNFLPIVLYTKAEGVPVRLYQKSENVPTKLYRRSETPAELVSFVIYIHADVLFDAVELSALVRQYCLPTKVFQIQIYA